jgi:E3 ubiquitin-protein ligase MARCH6
VLALKVIMVIRKRVKCFLVLVFSDAPVSELSLELLLLQVVLPALLEQGHTRQWLKRLVAAWTSAVAWLLDLRSYLIGDVRLEEGVRRGRMFLFTRFHGS